MEKIRVVEVKGVTKKIDGHPIIQGISCDIFFGESFGILGPPNSGKSALLQMMYGSLKIDVGDLYVLGLNAKTNPREMKCRLGIVPQEEALDLDFTVMENLIIFSSFLGLDETVALRRIEDLLKLLMLEAVAHHTVSDLGVSECRRLAIARGLLNQPELIFFDEPTDGLNQAERISVWNFLNQIRSENHSMVFTTSFAVEAEKIADRVALIYRGAILAIGEPEALIRSHVGVQMAEVNVDREDLQYYLNLLSDTKFEYQTYRNQLKIHLQKGEDIHRILDLFKDLNFNLRDASLADVFLKLSGHPLHEDPL
jgi:lipooligosaccharide transport system ATP-binding protein